MDSILFHLFYYFVYLFSFVRVSSVVVFFQQKKDPQQKAQTNNFFHSHLPFLFFQLVVQVKSISPPFNTTTTTLGIIPPTFCIRPIFQSQNFQCFPLSLKSFPPFSHSWICLSSNPHRKNPEEKQNHIIHFIYREKNVISRKTQLQRTSMVRF